MITFTATLKSKLGKEKELEEELLGMVSKVQGEEGAMLYILHRIKGTDGDFIFYEKYKDQKALDIHDTTPYMKELLKKLEVLLREPIVLNYFEELASISR
ncbi:MAG: putative quinol monooxygenase [Clostridia bacterium]